MPSDQSATHSFNQTSLDGADAVSGTLEFAAEQLTDNLTTAESFPGLTASAVLF